MTLSEELKQILNRIEKGEQTDEDINVLGQWLRDGDRLVTNQLAKYNVNIGEGKDIHIGDRIYNSWDEKAIQALVKQIQKVSGINQNTGGGDAAGRDVDKRNIYKDCTIFQFLVKGRDLTNNSEEYWQNLDLSGIPPEIIQQAYEASLPPDANVWDLQGNNPEQMLKDLAKFRRLSEFFERLIQSPDIPWESRDRLKEVVEKFPEKKSFKESHKHQKINCFPQPSRKLDSYILAALIPEDREHFFLNAWLIIDDSVPNLSKFQSLLEPNERQQGILCKLTQVPKEFNKFVKRARKLLRGKNYSLIVEFFLPSDLMCMEVDRWQIPDPIAEEIALGIKYPIRLRSLERLDLDYLDSYLPQWYEYWDRVRNILPNKPTPDLFEHLERVDSFNWKLLRTKLKEKIGLKVTCAHPESMRKDLFKAILQATTPIAVWTRTDITNLDRVTAMDEILTVKALRYLCESVQEVREKADAQTEEHLGFHLAILWENPYRLTPDLMVELIAPGQ